MARNFDGLYIGGRWVHPGRNFDDLNPATGDVWARVPDGSLADARAAIDAAQAAFPTWSALMFQQRSHYMIKIAEVVERRKKDLVEALKHEGGGWVGKGMFEAGYVPGVFSAAAASNYAAIGEVLPSENTSGT